MMSKEEESNLFTKINLHETINLPVAKIVGIHVFKLKFVSGVLFLEFFILSYILSFSFLLKLETDGGRNCWKE